MRKCKSQIKVNLHKIDCNAFQGFNFNMSLKLLKERKDIKPIPEAFNQFLTLQG